MTLAASPLLVAILVGGVFTAGLIYGVAGFGFAVVGTVVLATTIDPATAVAFMIVPIVAANVTLVRDLSTAQLRTCGRRFRPLILAALLGTLVGTALLGRLPAAPLRIAIGVVALAVVGTTQERVAIPGVGRAREGCFVESPLAMAGVGALGGLLFGGTNVGVQLVAYVRSCDLSHGLFVGVVAMLFLGINGLRVVAAGLLGLYPDATVFLLSVGATVPAVAGVLVGTTLRDHASEGARRGVVLWLLAIVGVRLVLDGLGVA